MELAESEERDKAVRKPKTYEELFEGRRDVVRAVRNMRVADDQRELFRERMRCERKGQRGAVRAIQARRTRRTTIMAYLLCGHHED